MLLKDYLNSSENKRRILVVSDLIKGLALIRKHEAETGILVRNVNCMTINQIVNQIYLYIQAQNGFELAKEIIDSNSSLMAFRGIIFKNIKSLRYFKEEKIMDIATTKEIFHKANLIRANGWADDETMESNPRIADLNLLISEYEQYLDDENFVDGIALSKFVLHEMKSWTDVSNTLDHIFAAEISYLVEEIDSFDGKSLEILNIIQKGEDRSVYTFEKHLDIQALTECKEKAEFFKGYGSFNEANFVANDIAGRKLPLGSVTVIYNSPTQLPAITSALRGHGLPMKIVSDYPASDNAYINLARRIIAWASEDYSEKALETILASSVMSVEVQDADDNTENILAKQSYYDYVLNAARRQDDSFILGWGFERNNDFLEHESAIINEDSQINLLKMHKNLLNIFGENKKPYSESNKVLPVTVYDKLVDFIEKYTYPTSEYAVGIDGIRRLKGAIRLEGRKLPLSEVLRFIDELLSCITVKDTASMDSITVQSLNDWILLDRDNVYVIGLSLKDMQGSTTESPVLTDFEMEQFLGDGYKPTIKNKALIKEKNLYRTLKSFHGEHIVFGYSSYDTVGFYDNNPSSFFRETLHEFLGKGTEDLTEFVYGNPAAGVKFSDSINISEKPVYDIKHDTSNSAIEVLLDCPKKYAFSKILYVPENEFVERDFAKWLNAAEKGTFFHSVAERYVTAKLVKPLSEIYETDVDEALLNSIVTNMKSELLIKFPVAFMELADQETQNMFRYSKGYLQRLHKELNTSGWRCLLTEQYFEKAAFSVETYEKEKFDFTFNGYIDRIDYKVDEAEKKIYLRIVDYKTGRKEKKDKEDKLGKLIQYAIYKRALMETGSYKAPVTNTEIPLLEYVKTKIIDLNTNGSAKIIENPDEFEFEFHSFQYVFPFEKKDETPLEILPTELEGLNITRLKIILTALRDKKNYMDHIDLYETVKEYQEKYVLEDSKISDLYSAMTKVEKNKEEHILLDEISHCKYCNYANLCEKRKAGVF